MNPLWPNGPTYTQLQAFLGAQLTVLENQVGHTPPTRAEFRAANVANQWGAPGAWWADASLDPVTQSPVMLILIAIGVYLVWKNA